MRDKEQKRVGLYILLINIILILFLLTTNEFDNMYLIITAISSMVAVIFNYHFLKLYKNIYNIITLILNVLITNGIIIYSIIYIFKWYTWQDK
jgi:hypothetical protein